MAKYPTAQTNRRGITVDEHLRMVGTNGTLFALGDCTATSYAPTAQVASQQGSYLARVLHQIAKQDKIKREIAALERGVVSTSATAVGGEEEEKEPVEVRKKKLEKQLEKVSKLKPFEYSHQGSLAYIGSEKAIADLPFSTGNVRVFFLFSVPPFLLFSLSRFLCCAPVLISPTLLL